MGYTKVIDRAQTVKTPDFWKGMETEVIASADECHSEILFYAVGTIPPGARTELKRHDTEIAWFLASGETLAVMVDFEADESEAVVCRTRASGYIAPGEGHLQVNLGDTDAVLLMAHVGANSLETAEGARVEPPEHVLALLREHAA
jgi:uncharacterized RmlC-like cupin family protein